MKVQTHKVFGLSAALCAMILVAPAANAEPQRGAFKAIWSDTSEVLNQSTEALNNGEPSRARRLAETAISDDLAYGDKLIAAHNLCIAHLELNTSAADTHCRAAMNAPSRMVVKPVNGELRIRSGRTNFVPSMGARTLSSVVGWNIQRIYNRPAPQAARATSTH